MGRGRKAALTKSRLHTLQTYSNLTLPILYAPAVSYWLFTGAAGDVVLSVTLYFNLRARIAGFNATTDNAIQALINVALRTASYTAFVATLGAVVSVAVPADSSGCPQAYANHALVLKS